MCSPRVRFPPGPRSELTEEGETCVTEDFDVIQTFFAVMFGSVSGKGFICISLFDREKKVWRDCFFEWPKSLAELSEFCLSKRETFDVYFCPQLLSTTRRTKNDVVSCPCAWADLDTCRPESLSTPASIEVQSSPDRYQAYWIFEESTDPTTAQGISKRIAYSHADLGVDKSGWDLSQVLRIPGTYNHKYSGSPLVKIIGVGVRNYRVQDFSKYPEPVGVDYIESPLEEDLPTESSEEILARFAERVPDRVWAQLEAKPEEGEDWSKTLFSLEVTLFEVGLSREEVFKVARDSAYNKFARDGRPNDLWKDIGRAHTKYRQNLQAVVAPESVLGPILSDEEIKSVADKQTFVERYIEWASGLGDAAVQYHQAGAFVILSALLANCVVLRTSFGRILPNLWFMLLGDTTLTRKSTAMDISADLLAEVDPDAIMATADGSIEGLLTGLSVRPNRSSIFLRDEVTGLLESMSKRDYMAGMSELLTKLYDGRTQKRILRKETIEVKDPILIVFAGGIKNRMQSLVTLEHVSSGFLPRFIFLTAESDVNKLQPLGPPTERDIGNRNALVDEMQNIVDHYHVVQDTLIKVTGVTIPAPKKWDARLTTEAWTRYAQFERAMLHFGVESERPEIMTPVYDRLSKSVLKAAVLIAAAEDQNPENVTVELEHLLKAMTYGDTWRAYAVDIINGVGKTADERTVERIMGLIKARPGSTRSQIMQAYHLTATQANAIFNTIEQRMLVYTTSTGRGKGYYAVGPEKT